MRFRDLVDRAEAFERVPVAELPENLLGLPLQVTEEGGVCGAGTVTAFTAFTVFTVLRGLDGFRGWFIGFAGVTGFTGFLPRRGRRRRRWR
ncbi:hypothetical protein HX747_18560 [Streptomyces sp. L06]|nr:hypothetical protein [Streptomyces sp. L06]